MLSLNIIIAEISIWVVCRSHVFEIDSKSEIEIEKFLFSASKGLQNLVPL